MSVDNVEHYDQSPYTGIDNNPVIKSDPNGNDASIRIIPNETGKGGKIIISTDVYVAGKVYWDGYLEKYIQPEINRIYQPGNFIDMEGGEWEISFDINVKQTTEFDDVVEVARTKGRKGFWDKEFVNSVASRLGDGNNIAIVGAASRANVFQRYNIEEGVELNEDGVERTGIVAALEGVIWAIPHEIGHFLGISDRYFTNSELYPVKGYKPHIGYEGDLMGESTANLAGTGFGDFVLRIDQSHFNNWGREILKYSEKRGNEFTLSEFVDRKGTRKIPESSINHIPRIDPTPE